MLKMNNIKKIIREEMIKMLKEDFDLDIAYDILEKKDEIMRETISDFIDAKEKGGGRQPWKVIPFPRLKKIWEDYIKYGHVRDRKGIEMIENLFTRNILKLDVNTELAGHSTHYPDDELEDFGIDSDYLFDDPKFDFGDYIAGPNGQPRISDYGLDPLLKLLEQLKHEQDYEKKLVILDKMLNVVHQRSDIAEMFIQGGTSSLNQLSGYYKPEDEDDPYADDVSSISGKYRMGDYKR